MNVHPAMSFFNELKRRNVFRVGIAYAVASWLLLQIVDLVLENIHAPDWIMQVFMLAMAVGFPIAIIIAWAFEMTADGVRLEKDVDRSQSITRQTSRKLDRSIIIVLVLAVVFLLYRQFDMGELDVGSASIPPATTDQNAGSAAKNLNPAPVASIEDKSIAVLPFVNMSSDPEQEYFSDGLAEELLNRLSKNDQLRVAARTSAFQFKGQNLDITDIGRQLKVAHVLEGSVRKSGNRLRITAQLIRVDTGFHLWSETYEREIEDIFTIQDDISLAISKALEITLGTASDTTQQAPTENLEAYNLYLQARYFLAQRGGQNMLKARDLFQQAVNLDPEFSDAWSGLAFNASILPGYSYSIDRNASFEETIQAANKAIELNPDKAEAYAAIGWAQASYLLDWQAAQENFEQAYRLGPNNISVVNLYADFLSFTGDYEQSIQLEKHLMDIDPLAAVHASDLASQLLELNRNQEALVPARTSMRLAPDSFDRIWTLVTALTKTAAFAEARDLIEHSSETLPVNADSTVIIAEWWIFYYYEQNNVEKLRELLTTELANPSSNEAERPVLAPGFIAFFTLWLDGVDAALPLLEEAYAQHDDRLTWAKFFYLPERISRQPEWLEFWNKPGLKELHAIRRANPYDNVGIWKERPTQ